MLHSQSHPGFCGDSVLFLSLLFADLIYFDKEENNMVILLARALLFDNRAREGKVHNARRANTWHRWHRRHRLSAPAAHTHRRPHPPPPPTTLQHSHTPWAWPKTLLNKAPSANGASQRWPQLYLSSHELSSILLPPSQDVESNSSPLESWRICGSLVTSRM